MKASMGFVVTCMAMCSLAGAPRMRAQNTSVQKTPAVAPTPACGLDDTEFKTKKDGQAGLTTPPAGKALVYVIEQMSDVPFLTSHVKLGIDGNWMAQLQRSTFVSYALDPGVHHFCMRYQGKAASPVLDDTILRRLNVEAGKTYYLLYRGIITHDVGEMGFFDEVDEDEGQYALQSAEHVTSTAVKKK